MPLLLATYLFAIDASLQDKGVEVQIEGKKIIVKRDINEKCLEFDQNAKNAWSGRYAADSLPQECRNSFANFMGYVSPVKIDGVETYGELETLEFLQKMQSDKKRYVFVDTRLASWFESGTIPGAVNMPFVHFVQQKKFDKELKGHFAALGVSERDGRYDFSKAKTVLFFCNGIWCGQSPQAIDALIKIGYPRDKILWYRGGVQDWRSVGLTTTASKN